MAIGSMTTNSTVDMIDKTLTVSGAPADAKATGNALAGKADSVVPHDLFIPITGWQTDTEVAEYPHYIDITADVTSTTVVSVSIDPASADVAGKAMLVNPETRTGAIRIRAHNIPTAEISARKCSPFTDSVTDLCVNTDGKRADFRINRLRTKSTTAK